MQRGKGGPVNSRPRILVVDDDAGGRRLTRATLNKAGFDVVEAADGQLAIDAARAALPDLVLMDVSMPVMDGFAACAALRALPGGMRVPVVMLTGLDDVKSIARAFEAGATDFITKPINWTILAHRVRYMLRASAAINVLEQNQRRLANAQRIGEMGDWEWDLRTQRVMPSDEAMRIFEHEGAAKTLEIEGFFATVHPDDIERLLQACNQAREVGDPFAIDHRIVSAVRGLRHVRQQVEVIERDEQGRPLRLAGAVHDITQRKQDEEQIRRLAYFDPLTGLPNRIGFTQLLHKAIALADRHRHRVATMFVDLDHFKRINDTLGHGAGDELLRQVSARLSASVRGHDAVGRLETEYDNGSIARLGGDEFVVMIGGIQVPAEAASVARRLVTALAEPVIVQGNEIFVSASFGIAIYPDDGDDIESLLKNADTAMYRAKEAGRGGFHFYDQSMNARALARLTMESQMRRALDRGEYVLHYQPRIDVANGAIVGAEALIRWQHPDQGLMLPAEFIPLAEDSGLVIPIGEWAVEEACRQLARWHERGLSNVSVAVNLAAPHLRERGLPTLVERAMGRHDLGRGLLEIEVTESILLSDPELSVEIAHRLGEMGIHLSIDDFGTGYSSLSYLKRLPIHALKIDRSFVRDLASDPDDAAIITAIIAMAHSLKLKVVAEGVETSAQLAFLTARQCDEYQGYLTHRPMPAAQFERLLQASAVSA